jgi:hypothetical protein
MSSMGCASDVDGASCGAKWKWGQLVELEGAIYRVEAVNRAVGGGGGDRRPVTSDGFEYPSVSVVLCIETAPRGGESEGRGWEKKRRWCER